MFELQGDWFDGKTSLHVPAQASVDNQGIVRVVGLASGQLLAQLALESIEVSSRIGSTPRYWYFPEGEKFETSNHDGVDAILHRFRPSLFNTLAHRLESHMQFVALTLVIVIAMAWWTVRYGLPAASEALAYALPQKVMNRAAEETLQILNKTHFENSTLDEATQKRVLDHFAPALKENANIDIRVIFRNGGDIGANAFALPDGTVVFTDEIVALAQNDDELLAVLAHEIGHVKYRHGLRATIQGSVLSFAASMLIGDVSAAANLLASLPLVLTTMSYSRNFEREADHNALSFLDAHQIPRRSFIDLMERLTYDAHCSMLIAIEDEKAEDEKSDEEQVEGEKEKAELTQRTQSTDAKASAAKPSKEDISSARKARCDRLMAEHPDDSHQILDYFSSHPPTEERLREFR